MIISGFDFTTPPVPHVSQMGHTHCVGNVLFTITTWKSILLVQTRSMMRSFVFPLAFDFENSNSSFHCDNSMNNCACMCVCRMYQILPYHCVSAPAGRCIYSLPPDSFLHLILHRNRLQIAHTMNRIDHFFLYSAGGEERQDRQAPDHLTLMFT